MMMSQAVVFACLAWVQLTTSPGGVGKPAAVVDVILRAEMTPEARRKALEPFLRVGMTCEDADRVLGIPLGAFGHGPGFDIRMYLVAPDEGLRGDVVVYCYPDGEIYRIAHERRGTNSIVFGSDDPVTWPKTTDGHNAKLREWKKDRR